MVVDNIVVVEGRPHANEEGGAFDNSTILLEEFSTEEIGIIFAQISMREEVEKEKAKGIDATTSEKFATPPTSPLKSLIELAAKEKEVIVQSTSLGAKTGASSFSDGGTLTSSPTLTTTMTPPEMGMVVTPEGQ